MTELKSYLNSMKRKIPEINTRQLDTTVRYSLFSLLAPMALMVPVSAQISSAEEASNVEGVGILEGIVYFLMGVVPIAATALLLGSFLVLMFTRDPQKTSTVKEIRNRAIVYGYVFVPSLGLILAGIGTITGNPVLEGMF